MNRTTLLFLAAMLAAGNALADEALAKQKGCTACHAIDKKLVGPAYRDVAVGYSTAPLYCVSPGNSLPVTGFGLTDAANNPIPPVQAEGPCPSSYKPSRPNGFFNRLTLTFSIGQAF